MDRYSTFHFEQYTWNPHGRKIVLRYSLDHSVAFEETLLLPDHGLRTDNEIDHATVDQLLQALHLIGGISYFKTCIPRDIKLDHGTLGQKQAAFWDSVYQNGLGQFFYENDIDFRGLLRFPWTKEAQKPVRSKFKTEHIPLKRILIPIGGGKDSMVTIELLRKSGAQLSLLRLGGTHPIIDDLTHAAGLPLLTVKRLLSENLFKLNEQGALNGHVPITAYLSILAVLIAELYDFDAVAMSNEASASEGNVTYRGLTVNHQWSKSLEFEKSLRQYLQEWTGSDVQYFSALRPFSELRIAELFSRFPQYFGRFTSCNTNWKIVTSGKREAGNEKRSWCCQCPKCAFVFALLAAFLPRATLEAIFGANLFADESLLPLYRELLGLEKFKPFECVGTAEETKAAFLLARKRGDLDDTAAMEMFAKDVLPGTLEPEKLIDEALRPHLRHCIPGELAPSILADDQ